MTVLKEGAELQSTNRVGGAELRPSRPHARFTEVTNPRRYFFHFLILEENATWVVLQFVQGRG